MGNTLKGRIKKLFGMHNPNYVFREVSANAVGKNVCDDNGHIGVKADTLKGVANYANVDSDAEITGDGVKTSSTNTETKAYPVQRALDRIEELNYITDVRIDEDFETTVDDFPKNRLTITIDYLDVNFVKEARESEKYELYQEV